MSHTLSHLAHNSIFFNSISQEGSDGPDVSSMDCDTGGGRGGSRI